MSAKQHTFFAEQRLQMSEAMALTVASLTEYGEAHKHWALAFSGGKDSTALATLVAHLLDAGRIPRPESFTVLYADTRMEMPPLWLSAQTVLEDLRERDVEVRTVMAPMEKRFLPYILGRGVPPPNNNTLRWCTRQIKVDPMHAELAKLGAERGELLTLTGVRQGESAMRDQRIALSCSKGDGECGQGWYQHDRVARGHATLAPLLHWRVCHVWEWLKHWAPRAEFGDWSTELVADVYGGDEAEELNARTGCLCCPLANRDTALLALVARERWAYLAPLLRLRALYQALRTAPLRLRKAGGETCADGTPVANQHRMGPLTLEARTWALGEVLAIQAEVNESAEALGRPRVDILNAEEEAFVRAEIAAGRWPQRWSGDEPRADQPFDEGSEHSLFGE